MSNWYVEATFKTFEGYPDSFENTFQAKNKSHAIQLTQQFFEQLVREHSAKKGTLHITTVEPD